MALATLRVGQLIKRGHEVFSLQGKLPGGKWQLLEVESGATDYRMESELWAEFETGTLRFLSAEEFDGRVQLKPDSQVMFSSNAGGAEAPAGSGVLADDAAKRLVYVRRLKDRPRSPAADPYIEEIWRELKWPAKKPHRNAVFEWLRKCDHVSDPVNALEAKHRDKGNTTDRYPELRETIQTLLRRYYLQSKPRLTVAKVVERIGDDLKIAHAARKDAGSPIVPGRRYIESLINEIPAHERIERRDGPDAARTAMRFSLGGRKILAPLEMAELDHTVLSVILLDEEFCVWGRPQSTVQVDSGTRVPTGAYWGPEVPSIVSVSRCIKIAVMPKIEIMRGYPDVNNPWSYFGVPHTISADNGLEEHATALRQATSQMGGTWVEFSGVRSGWHKPHVERHIRTCDQDLLHALPATTRENVVKRGKFDPKHDVILRRETFAKIYMKWLVDILPFQHVDALGTTPNEAWRRGTQGRDIYVPTSTTLLDALFLRLEVGKSLDHEGITYDCLTYNSRDMGMMRNELGAKLLVDIRVSDEDLGYVFVKVPGQEIWIRVNCTDFEYANGRTRWQHERCKKMKAYKRDDGIELSLAQSRNYIYELVEIDRDALKSFNRKKHSRFTETPAPPPVAAPAPPVAITSESVDSPSPTADALPAKDKSLDDTLRRPADRPIPDYSESMP